MVMGSSAVYIRELRRHDFLEEAARERLARSASKSQVNDRTSPIRLSWISNVYQGLTDLPARLRITPQTPGVDDVALARR